MTLEEFISTFKNGDFLTIRNCILILFKLKEKGYKWDEENKKIIEL